MNEREDEFIRSSCFQLEMIPHLDVGVLRSLVI